MTFKLNFNWFNCAYNKIDNIIAILFNQFERWNTVENNFGLILCLYIKNLKCLKYNYS